MLERNEHLVKEMENVKTQNINLREQIAKFEAELNDANVCISFLNHKYMIFSSRLDSD